MRYDLTDLRLFRAIASTGSLTAAGERIFMSPGSASYRLANLERMVGTKLFLRTPRRMEITAAGEQLLKHVAGILCALEAMHSEMDAFSEGLRGRIHILANSSALHGFLPQRLSKFLLDNPQIDLELDEQRSETIPIAVAEGLADFGIVAGNVLSADLEAYPVGRDDLVLAVPASHVLACHKAIWLEQALDYDFISMHRSTSNFHFLTETASKLGKRPRIRMQGPSFQAVLSLVALNVGVALVPRSVISDISQDSCRYIALRDPWAVRTLTAMARADIARSPLVARLFAHLRVLQKPER